MRIGIICPYSFDEPGGVQAHILDLARVFIAEGHQVQVLGPASKRAQVPSFVVRGGWAIPFRYNGSVARLAVGPQVVWRTRRFIERGNFDVLHIHEPNSPSFSMIALKVATGPLVATYHASAAGSKLLKFFLPLMRPYLEKIRGGIAVSEMARRWQVEQLGGDPVLIPNGVDIEQFRRAYLRWQSVAHPSPAAGEERPVEVVFLGRLDESRKGLDILLAAVRTMRRKVKVTVIGGGRARKAAPEGVTFVGRVSDERKAEILGRADIYVAPNTGGESFGIVLVEAMAAGCAVVASDLEAFAAVCDAGAEQPAGLLFRNRSVPDLAASLDRLVDRPDERAALVRAGIKRAQRYDWSRVAAEVMAVYETVVDGTKVGVN